MKHLAPHSVTCHWCHPPGASVIPATRTCCSALRIFYSSESPAATFTGLRSRFSFRAIAYWEAAGSEVQRRAQSCRRDMTWASLGSDVVVDLFLMPYPYQEDLTGPPGQTADQARNEEILSNVQRTGDRPRHRGIRCGAPNGSVNLGKRRTAAGAGRTQRSGERGETEGATFAG